ncbi:MAG: hypothetical protein GY835_12290 [bacterium]|nr:hypothetical protein [bacterium]
MIDANTAVQKAYAFLDEMKDRLDLKDLSLEEVEFSEDGNAWRVTLSFSGSTVASEKMTDSKPPRSYKLFIIDGETGDLVSMKIWPSKHRD